MQDDGFPFRFLLGALATWRVTHLLVEEDGPGDAVVRLRRLAGDGWVGGALDCSYCLSIWTAVPIAAALARRRREAPLIWLALSGAACLLERATTEKGDLDVLWEQAQADTTPEFGDTDACVPGWPDRERAATSASR
ncbi:MAG TPA: DUF1360 domain-containing protein [Gaiellaceae bacterium]|nr:DUF1360 domain-containing protein [Gaiellaceae bacterium]